jgi:hypothetical protein
MADWSACSGSEGVECGYAQSVFPQRDRQEFANPTVYESVPLDYQNSEAGVARLALARIKASRKPRLGTLSWNPGMSERISCKAHVPNDML